jgi:hypothetical protein
VGANFLLPSIRREMWPLSRRLSRNANSVNPGRIHQKRLCDLAQITSGMPTSQNLASAKSVD